MPYRTRLQRDKRKLKTAIITGVISLLISLIAMDDDDPILIGVFMIIFSISLIAVIVYGFYVLYPEKAARDRYRGSRGFRKRIDSRSFKMSLVFMGSMILMAIITEDWDFMYPLVFWLLAFVGFILVGAFWKADREADPYEFPTY